MMTNRCRGFTLLELMVTTVILVVISGAALALFSKQQPLFNRQQNQAGLNIAIRNAVSQLQLDVVNAGSGTLLGPSIPNPPVAVTIVNSIPTSPCNTPSTYSYGSNCFDQLNVITSDANTALSHPDNGSFIPNNSTNCINSTASPMYLVPPTGTTVAAATAFKANFKNGDELMLVVVDTSQMTTIKLNADATVYTNGANSGVKLTFNVTNADGSNSTANDPLYITTTSGDPKFGTQFCSDDWVIRLAPIVYWVDTAAPSDPKLVRTQGGAVSSPCTGPVCSVVADQVIGFKVGAALWNTTTTDDCGIYNYFASNAIGTICNSGASTSGYNNEFWLVRSLQISLIGRTTPVTDPTYTYRNGFDNGPYQIESVSLVVNPRNLTMNNQ
jgi:prepilin-type N-terminal cleavage/methylation domain-containing protein